MEALEGIQIRDRAALVDDVLVVADLHVGRGAASNVELPVGAGREMVDRFETLCEECQPREIVVAGDLLHSFDSVPRLVEETLSGLRGAARSVGARIVVTPGNHDTMLDAVWSGPTTPEYRINETVVCHGHVEPATDADRYLVGHDHPMITIEGQKHPCYLFGNGHDPSTSLVVLPPFNRLLAGVEINQMRGADFLSPLIEEPDRLSPVVYDENAGETLRFPPLGEFRHRL